MESNTNGMPPNLADILSTLSRFAPPPTSDQTPGRTGGVIQPTVHEPYTQAPGASGHQFISSPYPSQSTGVVVDPATITDWSSGLRCVTKIASQNPNFSGQVRSMIINQRKNEMDWYARRQELKKEQSQKGTGLTELASIMKSVGAFAAQAPQQLSSEEENKAELDAFDAKIYRAQAQMSAALTAELKALGVPFFGTRADVILPDPEDHSPKVVTATKSITVGELRALQRRMIAYLEDMYRD